jgi:2-amino-4-hydroxy-6-hydroxymethyldihydropteridine diphosphokinase
MALLAHRATIALGANLGNRESAIHSAVKRLGEMSEIADIHVSQLYRTAPVAAEGPDFCNAAARFNTSLSPQALLGVLLEIEQQFGRRRSVRNAPRTLDLDLITFDNQFLQTDTLTLPHPRAHARAFVLIPLCEIDSTVLLGPDDRPEKKPAAHWLAQLSPAQREQVRPW